MEMRECNSQETTMKTKFFTLFLLTLLMFFANSALASEGHDDDQDDGMGDMGEHEAADQCETPTTEITIKGGENGEIAFDKTEYQVPKNACVEVIFINFSPVIEHDASIDEIHEILEEVHLHSANNTDGHEGDGAVSMHIQTPNEDTEFEIYCSVEGHKSAGMVATLVVGEGLPGFLPGFEFLGLLFGMSVMVIIYKKKIN